MSGVLIINAVKYFANSCKMVKTTDFVSVPINHADLSYSEFRRSLKTVLFGQWGHGAV